MWLIWFEKLKPYLLKIVSYAAVAAIGIGVGWRLKPAAVEVHEKLKVVEVEKQVVVVREQVRVEVVRVKDSQVVDKTHTETTETKSVDGTVVKKVVEDKNIDSVVHDRETATEVKVVEVEKQVVVVQKETVEKVVKPALPNWRTSALLGIQPQILPTPGVSGYVYGTEVERRVAGPIWLGVWGTMSDKQQATVGIKGTWEFQ